MIHFSHIHIAFIFSAFLAVFCTISYISYGICQKFLSTTHKKSLQSFVVFSHAMQGTVTALLSANMISILLTQKSEFQKSLSEEASYLRTLRIIGNTGDLETQQKTKNFILDYANTLMHTELKYRTAETKRTKGRRLIESFYRWAHTKAPTQRGLSSALYQSMCKEINHLCHARSKRIIASTARIPVFILIALSMCTFFLLIGIGFHIEKTHVLYDISLSICCASLAIIATVIVHLHGTFYTQTPGFIIQDIVTSLRTSRIGL